MQDSFFFRIFAAVHARMHHEGARTYTQEQINYDERILFIDRSAGSGADIIAKGWEENHWARPTIKDSYFPSEETELVLDLEKVAVERNADNTTQTTQTTAQTTQTTTLKIIELMRQNADISIEKIAAACGITRDGVNYQIRQMKKKNLIRRIGGDFGGHWEIVEG